MSYDIYLKDPDSNVTIAFDNPHDLKGGTYALGGTAEAWLNITYNYSEHFYAHMGEQGIRTIYGMTGEASMPILEGAIAALGDDVDADYWAATEGNAKQALIGLLGLARERPDGIWAGD